MDQFVSSCDSAGEYPRNLIHPNAYVHKLRACAERLNSENERVFSNEARAAVDFLDFDDQAQTFRPACVRNIDELKKQLRFACVSGFMDPRCRFIFISAPHSRERLKITREMLMVILTYYQVMPSFLDFLFTFGRQEYAQDFHFSAFWHETRLTEMERGLLLSDLGRSGRDIRLCYSLRSVEPSTGQEGWPWSVRQTALYHSLDVVTGRTTWIFIKGDQLMKRRIKDETGPDGSSAMNTFTINARAFASTLATHLIVCDWAGEHWRWYISFLEKELQHTTRRALSAKVGKQPEAAPEMTPLPTPLSTPFVTPRTTFVSESRVQQEPCMYSFLKRIADKVISPVSTLSPSPCNHTDRGGEQPSSPTVQADFSFGDLQRIQFLEDKANETSLVLEVNLKVLGEIKRYYLSVTGSEDCPAEFHRDCKMDISRFEQRVMSVENDLGTQHSRVRTLLRLLADRKNLLYGILQYRNMEASKSLAEEAQRSAKNMENMTGDMHEIAKRTKQETVSMKIITLVTLFFLPGTYISTLMSTDIVRYQTESTGPPVKVFQPGALRLYLAITLPLMIVTFLGWYGVYWWVNWKDTRRAAHKVNDAVRHYSQV